jgi:LysM repeat protein
VTVTLSAVFAASTFTPTPASAASCTEFYKARTNDSWSRIASRYNMSLSKLLSLNSAKTSSLILVGAQICTSDKPVLVIPEMQYKRKEIVAIIREIWPDEHEENALFVANRESNMKPNVVGGVNDCCIGLFQIYYSVHRSWLTNIGVTEPQQLLDPRVNTQAAYALFKRNGNSWKPWWTKSWRP